MLFFVTSVLRLVGDGLEENDRKYCWVLVVVDWESLRSFHFQFFICLASEKIYHIGREKQLEFWILDCFPFENIIPGMEKKSYRSSFGRGLRVE